ncbi:MAG: metal-dependent hydrolase [Nanoarchaeota archaeon]|nr:metal-dependent hydrolase [Nanoarchaeota archaeon]
MLGRTHLLWGFFLSLVFITLFSFLNPFFIVVLSLFASLLPDIDEKKSFIGRYFRNISFFFSHRGVFHSVFAAVLFSCFVWFFSNFFFAGIFFSAYFFHLLFDSATKQGIKPFYFGRRISGFVKTGSFVEKIIFFCLIIINIFLLLKII